MKKEQGWPLMMMGGFTLVILATLTLMDTCLLKEEWKVTVISCFYLDAKPESKPKLNLTFIMVCDIQCNRLNTNEEAVHFFTVRTTQYAWEIMALHEWLYSGTPFNGHPSTADTYESTIQRTLSSVPNFLQYISNPWLADTPLLHTTDTNLVSVCTHAIELPPRLPPS